MQRRRRTTGLLTTSLCAVLGASALSPIPVAAAEVLPRATADRPDDREGPQVRLLYLLPQDAPDLGLDTDGTIASSVDAANRWLQERTGRVLDVDTADGALDVTFVRLPRTAEEYERASVRLPVQEDLRAMGQDDGQDTLFGFYAGKTDIDGRCGESYIGPRRAAGGDFLSLIFEVQADDSSCGAAGFAGPGEQARFQDVLLVHELFHAAGAVTRCVPHFDGDAHVDDDPDDLMLPIIETTAVVDAGHDDYFGLDPSSPCTDVARSELLLPDAFIDLTRSVHAEGVRALAGRGVVGGFGDGTYRPGDAVTRGQIATFVSRAGGFEPDGTSDPTDVPPGSAHGTAVRALLDNQVATGYPDGTYRAEPEVTRGQTASLLARALQLPVPADCRVDDAEGVHRDGICAVVEAGIAGGYGDRTYRPGQPVTRGQMATLVAKAFPG